MLARVYNANALPTSNLRENLCSDLCNNLHNNLDLRTAPLISNNSHLFLHIHSTSFRRFSVEGDSKTSAVPKVATEVATSMIQTGSSCGGYREESNIRGEAVGMAQLYRQSTKKELPVSAAAINPITVVTDMPCNPISLVPICIQT